MKKHILFYILILFPFYSYSQIGIGTNNPEATLDIRAKNPLGNFTTKDGLLIPRVNQLASNGVEDGQLIFLIENKNGYQRGFYYWETTNSKWLYLGETLAQDTTNDSWSNNTTLGAVHIPNLSDGSIRNNADTDLFITDDGKLGIGKVPTQAKLELRSQPGNSNPGEGAIGIGETNMAASTAGEGALRYYPQSGGLLQYSDGSNWKTLSNEIKKIEIISEKTSNQTISDATVTPVKDWNIQSDNSNGKFDATTGIFTAPRTGNYAISFNYAFQDTNVTYTESRVEAQITIFDKNNSQKDVKKSVVGYSGKGNGMKGALVSFVIRLEKDESIQPTIYHSTGRAQITTSQAGYNNLSICEL